MKNQKKNNKISRINYQKFNIDDLFEDPETASWLEEEYDREMKEKNGQQVDE